MKFLIISAVIIFTVFLLINRLLRKFSLALAKAANAGNAKSSSKPKDKVLYEKGDVVVLQGESMNSENRKYSK